MPSMINQAIAGRPEDMVISMHLCRGNFRSTWVASGGYEPVAEVLFNQIDVGCVFHGIRHRPRRRVRAAALRAARAEDGRAGDDDQQDRRTGKQGRAEAPHR